MREVLRDRVFYDESGGGVTFSGGEPLAQPEFLAALLDACRAAEIHTAVDTCGFAPRERLLALAPLVDLFLFDVKLVDDARHRALTGLPSAPILANLRALAMVHPDVWIRVPVVPGFTDAEADLAATAALVAGLPGTCAASSSFPTTGPACPRPAASAASSPQTRSSPRRASGSRRWPRSSASAASPRSIGGSP